jgi:hypothetical protein
MQAKTDTAKRPSVIYSHLRIFIDMVASPKFPLVRRLLQFERKVLPGLKKFYATKSGSKLTDDTIRVEIIPRLPYDIPLTWASSGGLDDDTGGELIEGWAINLRSDQGRLNFEKAGLDYLVGLIKKLPILRVTSHRLINGSQERRAVDKGREPELLVLEWVRLRR